MISADNTPNSTESHHTDVVRTRTLEDDAAEQHAEEAADLMAEEGKPVQHRQPARAEHQRDERRCRRHRRQPGKPMTAPNTIAETGVIGSEMNATIASARRK